MLAEFVSDFKYLHPLRNTSGSNASAVEAVIRISHK